MFEAKLNDAGLLKRIIDAVRDLIADAPFDCSESAICLQAMDSSHVALVSLKLEVALFDTYRCDRSINLGLSLKLVSNALKCSNNTDACLIKYEDDADQVTFTFIDSKREKTSDITIKLMDIDSEHLGIPDQEYAATIEMPSEEFKKTCANLTLFSDAINITATKGNVIFSGKGDNGNSTITYGPGGDTDEQEAGISIEVHDPVNAHFSIKYMNQFVKATPLCKKVRLQISNDMPIVVEYAIEESGYLRFYLAPKIDDSEDKDMDG